MSDASPSERTEAEDLGKCGWCQNQAIDLIYTQGKPSNKKHKTAPVCGDHYRHFIASGLMSRRDYWVSIGRKR